MPTKMIKPVRFPPSPALLSGLKILAERLPCAQPSEAHLLQAPCSEFRPVKILASDSCVFSLCFSFCVASWFLLCPWGLFSQTCCWEDLLNSEDKDLELAEPPCNPSPCLWVDQTSGERGLLLIVVHRLLIAVASLCCRAQALGTGFSSCSAWSQ